MKKLHHSIRIGLVLATGLLAAGLQTQAQDSVATEPQVALRYFNSNNSIQSLQVLTTLKTGRKSQPLPHQTVKVFLDENSPESLIATTTTGIDGKGMVWISPALKDKWMSGPKHSFQASMKVPASQEEITASLDISRAKIELDTANADGARSINVRVSYLDSNIWKPASDVELKVGVDRSGAVLSAGDEATYTTDSSGTVSVEFKKEKLPGDKLGNIILVARADDNDQFGNIAVEKTVAWGVAAKPLPDFFSERALWSTRFRTPYWLLFMAYSIVLAVWSTIIYLIFQLIKIKKLAKESV